MPRPFSRSSDYGQLVTNPPYGERLLEQEEAGRLYRAFGQAAAALPENGGYISCPPIRSLRHLHGSLAAKKRKLYNGMIKCDLFLCITADPAGGKRKATVKHIFIINPGRGVKNGAAHLMDQIEALRRVHNLTCETVLTGRQGHAERKWPAGLRKGEAVRLYACGGDGTLNEVLNGAAGADRAEITVVPTGTGNDFFEKLRRRRCAF